MITWQIQLRISSQWLHVCLLTIGMYMERKAPFIYIYGSRWIEVTHLFPFLNSISAEFVWAIVKQFLKLWRHSLNANLRAWIRNQKWRATPLEEQYSNRMYGNNPYNIWWSLLWNEGWKVFTENQGGVYDCIGRILCGFQPFYVLSKQREGF